MPPKSQSAKPTRITPEDVVLRAIYRGFLLRHLAPERFNPIGLIENWAWALHTAGAALGVPPQPMDEHGMPLTGRVKADLLRAYDTWKGGGELGRWDEMAVGEFRPSEQNYRSQALRILLKVRALGQWGNRYSDMDQRQKNEVWKIMEDEIKADLNPILPPPPIAPEPKKGANKLASAWYESQENKDKAQELDTRFPGLPADLRDSIKRSIYLPDDSLSRLRWGGSWSDVFGSFVWDGAGGMKPKLAYRLEFLWGSRAPIDARPERDALEAWLADYVRWAAAESHRLARGE